MDEKNILGKKRAEKLKKLLSKGKTSPEDALLKVWPQPEIEPIYGAWKYLLHQNMVVTSVPHVAESYSKQIEPFKKWDDEVIKRWMVLTYLHYNMRELEIRDLLNDLVIEHLPNYSEFKEEDRMLLEKAAQENIKAGNLDQKVKRFHTLLGVDIISRALDIKLLTFRVSQINKENYFFYSCLDENFGEFSKYIKMIS